jgi:hypothetical protein
VLITTYRLPPLPAVQEIVPELVVKAEVVIADAAIVGPAGGEMVAILENPD